MNLWECDTRGCPSTAVGIGGALGLRAIGWAVTVGGKDPRLQCPACAGTKSCEHCFAVQLA